ncbi:MAG: ClbS/DfsB family four-helix bundle protein, partial [Acidimicrobiia bacterium]|nr:ClbS/DfsB family four-helix bundle protein [Acidimicrobiia bacterium]
MPRPATRADLLAAIDSELARLIAQVQQVPPADRLRPGACGEWSVKDVLAHLDAWHEMFLDWEAAGCRGEKPVIPAPGYTWATTPALNEEIRRRH